MYVKTASCEKVEGIDSVLKRLRKLSDAKFTQRAAGYDRDAAFPRESLRDLYDQGFWGAAIPKRFGGLGFGPVCGEPLGLWSLTRELARVDMSLARCWEGHVNASVVLSGVATEAQQERFFGGMLEKGHLWANWSGEPLTATPSENQKIGTKVTCVDGGYRVNGVKVFCSAAPGVDRAILFVNTQGSGGSRSAHQNGVLMLVCDVNDPGVSLDDSWWDPMGMRGSASYMVRFDDVFIPKDNQIGELGQYPKEAWQTRFIPQFASTFLGAADAALEQALIYIRKQDKEKDPFVQQHIGQMAVNVETGELWLEKTARLWQEDPEAAKHRSIRFRHVMEHLAEDTVKRAIRACGARSLNRPCPIERIYRDLTTYLRHDNDDHNLAMIGKDVLGEDFDPSFFHVSKS